MLVNEEKEAGYYEAEFNPQKTGTWADVSSGIYIYTIEVRSRESETVFRASNKMILVK